MNIPLTQSPSQNDYDGFSHSKAVVIKQCSKIDVSQSFLVQDGDICLICRTAAFPTGDDLFCSDTGFYKSAIELNLNALGQ